MALSIDDLTKNDLQGSGAFDRIMDSMELHIQEEFKKGRVTGSNYAQVYTQSIQVALQGAIQFLLNKDLADAQIEEIKARIKETEARTELAKKNAELVQAQIESQEFERELTKWRSVSEQAQTQKIVEINKDYVDKELNNGNSNVHGVIGSSIDVSDKQAWAVERSAELNVAKTLVTDVYNVIESNEGIGANKFGLNGSNAVSILNAVRSGVGMPKISVEETEYNASSQKYKDTWSPDVDED